MNNIIKKLPRIILYIFLIGLALLTLMPIIFSFFASFKSNQELLTNGSSLLPKEFILDNYIQAWQIANFAKYTWNSVWMTFFTVIGVVIMSSMVGYVFSRGKFKGKSIVFLLFTSTMFISLGTITLHPTIQVAKLLHLNKSLWGVILITVLGANVTNIYLVRGFVDSLPKEIDEAAMVDGCGFFGIFVRIILPLIKPILATIAILSFKNAWNEYLLPMLFTVGNPDKMPLVVGIVALKGTGEGATSWNLMLAGMMISLVPMITIYLCLNRYFIEGLTAGSVKG